MIIEVESRIALSHAIDILRFSCYYRWTARITAVGKKTPKPSLKNLAAPVEAECVQNAELLWIKEAQKSLQQRFEKGKFNRLCARKRKDGIIVVCGRIPKSSEYI